MEAIRPDTKFADGSMNSFIYGNIVVILQVCVFCMDISSLLLILIDLLHCFCSPSFTPALLFPVSIHGIPSCGTEICPCCVSPYCRHCLVSKVLHKYLSMQSHALTRGPPSSLCLSYIFILGTMALVPS